MADIVRFPQPSLTDPLVAAHCETFAALAALQPSLAQRLAQLTQRCLERHQYQSRLARTATSISARAQQLRADSGPLLRAARSSEGGGGRRRRPRMLRVPPST